MKIYAAIKSTFNSPIINHSSGATPPVNPAQAANGIDEETKRRNTKRDWPAANNNIGLTDRFKDEDIISHPDDSELWVRQTTNHTADTKTGYYDSPPDELVIPIDLQA